MTGLDLVEWQLRVASGEPLPLAQSAIQARGHAIEARIYSEDPRRGFLPSVGRVRRFAHPPEDDAWRVDAGIADGDVDLRALRPDDRQGHRLRSPTA